jgi:hypothetical protein
MTPPGGDFRVTSGHRRALRSPLVTALCCMLPAAVGPGAARPAGRDPIKHPSRGS